MPRLKISLYTHRAYHVGATACTPQCSPNLDFIFFATARIRLHEIWQRDHCRHRLELLRTIATNTVHWIGRLLRPTIAATHLALTRLSPAGFSLLRLFVPDSLRRPIVMYLHPLIANVPRAERVALVQSCELRSYRRNETVLAANEQTNCIYCVASGLLRVVAHGKGNAQIGDVTTDFIRQDDFFLGTSLAEDNYQAMQTLVAALPTSVYLVPITAVRRLCVSYPEIAIGLLTLTMKRMDLLRNQLRRISALSSEDLVGRVLHQLTVLAPTSRGAYDKRITQSVIASYAGLSREVVNRTMREMESRGLVRRDEHGVHIPADFASTDFGERLPEKSGCVGLDETEPMLPLEVWVPSDALPARKPRTDCTTSDRKTRG